MKRSVPDYVERGRASGAKIMADEVGKIADMAEAVAKSPGDIKFFAIMNAFYFGVAVGKGVS